MNYKIKSLMLTLLAVATLNSCDLDMEPEDTISPESYFANGNQMQLWTNGYYTMFTDAESAAGSNADDNIDNQLGELMMGQRSAASESSWTWTQLRNINYFLANSDRCKDAAAKKQYDGVSYFFRAYFYFNKVRRYGDVPWYDEVLQDNDYAQLKKPRDNREVIMDHVMEDLDNAIAMLPTNKDVARVTKWTALALKSRAALYEGTFRKYHGIDNGEKYLRQAAEAAENFINNSGYKLYTTGSEPYRDLFNSLDAKSDEVILARIYNSSANVLHGVQFNITNNKQGFTKRYMNHYLMADGSFFSAQPGYDTMIYTEEVANRDPRLAQTVLCPGYKQTGATKVTANTLNAITGYQPIKFVGASTYDGANKAFTDFPLFRAAEVYLDFAEAKAEMGTLTQTDLDKSINKIRARAKMPNMSLDAANSKKDPLMVEYYPNVTQNAQSGAILEIRRERTVELAMEGQRIWDILRWKEGAQLTKPFYGCYFPGEGEYDFDGDGNNDLLIYSSDKGSFNGTAKKLDKDITLTGKTSGYINALPTIKITWDENRDYLWPIPASERVLSSGTLSQNPGWDDSTNF